MKREQLVSKREYRVFKAMKIRASGDGKGITGCAAVYNQPSEEMWGFRELIKPGCFTRCLGTNPDVRCLFNHDTNQVLGRTKAGTLRLTDKADGLYFDCELSDTQAARDVKEMITRGDVDQCSFGFMVRAQNWREEKDADGDTLVTRELTDLDLFDVSPVTFPAYPQTSVSMRELWPDGEPDDVVAYRARGGAPAPPDDDEDFRKRLHTKLDTDIKRIQKLL